MITNTTSQEFFEEKYRRQQDPWNFAGSDYEQQRYDAIVQALAHRQYGQAFEPGCSVGVLTARLAPLCERLQAMDISPTAVQQAQSRCRLLSNVEITCGAFPGSLPRGPFDLIVFSEVGYYLDEAQLQTAGDELVQRLAPQGVFLAAHWLGKSQDHLLSGDRVHEILLELGGLAHEYAERHAGFRLDRWIRQ